METNKAPNPDGFHADLYHKFCPLVKDDFKGLLDDFCSGELDIARFNYGVISLILENMQIKFKNIVLFVFLM